jgi:hypothetical protein
LGEDFVFSGACISVAQGGINSIDALEDDLYSCVIDPENANRIIITRMETVTVKTFRIKAFVINPNIVTQSKYSVYYFPKNSDNQPLGQIIARQESSAYLFRTTAITVLGSPFTLHWGFPLLGSHSPNLKTLIYTNSAGLYAAYQNLKFGFQISKNSPTDSLTTFYRIKINLGTTLVATVNKKTTKKKKKNNI